jgi:hypothetical protein
MLMKDFKPSHFYMIFDPHLDNDYQDNWKPDFNQAHAFSSALKKKVEDPNCRDESLYWGKLSLSKGKEVLSKEEMQLTVERNKKHGCNTHL